VKEIYLRKGIEKKKKENVMNEVIGGMNMENTLKTGLTNKVTV
jgi:hypothetical protein